MRTSLLFAPLLCTPLLHAQIVINEVDYDQIGTDNAEYLELKNTGEAVFPLQYLRVVFINGNNGGAVEYRTVESPSWPALEPGGYFVICANQGLTLNCDHAASPSTNLIQNGPADAIALVSTVNETVYDVLSYGGSVPGFTEGTGSTAIDSNEQDGLSLSRWPDGADSDNNDADFVIGCPTPGVANVLDPVDCAITTGIAHVNTATVLSIVPDVREQGLSFRIAGTTATHVVVSVYAANGTLLAVRDLGTTAIAQGSIPVGSGGQLLLVRVQTGEEVFSRRVVMP
ncbi:MAG: lamin tail domain-containing protein [Flavobacteriales bacterium]|nr:lamin tail domain-containing protein [Flavobacteriales bacterium]